VKSYCIHRKYYYLCTHDYAQGYAHLEVWKKLILDNGCAEPWAIFCYFSILPIFAKNITADVNGHALLSAQTLNVLLNKLRDFIIFNS